MCMPGFVSLVDLFIWLFVGRESTFSTATWKCSSFMGWLVMLEKDATMWICPGWVGWRRATNSIRSDVLSTCSLFVEGRPLLCGRDEVKFHSSSSGALAAGPGCGDGFDPARSRSDDEAGAGG